MTARNLAPGKTLPWRNFYGLHPGVDDAPPSCGGSRGHNECDAETRRRFEKGAAFLKATL